MIDDPMKVTFGMEAISCKLRFKIGFLKIGNVCMIILYWHLDIATIQASLSIPKNKDKSFDDTNSK